MPLKLKLLILTGCLIFSPLLPAKTLLEQYRIIDLSHPFASNIPHWHGFESATRQTVYDYQNDGFKTEIFCHVGQWGTHIDAPSHFFADLRNLDQIAVEEMILPLVVIDVSKQVADTADYTVNMRDIEQWEARHGTIPAGSFVALRTDWSKRWPDQAKMQNQDSQGVSHYPGWSLPVLRYLYEQRGIVASGHETTDTDPGLATSQDDYALERYVLGNDHYQVEMLTNLDAVPENGASIIVCWPNVEQGTGFPVRVLALIPRQ